MTTRTSVTSLEYYRLTITPSPDVDPTTFPVRFAFPASGSAPATWYAAQWESGGPPYIARLTIGPAGDVELEAGAYDVYAEVTDSPEIVTFLADRLIVFEDVTSFASVAELADVLHVDIDPEDAAANQALTDATAMVRSYTRQTLSFVEGDEVTLDGHYQWDLALPEFPIVDVTEVVEISVWDNAAETTLDTTDFRFSKAVLHRLDRRFCEGFQNVRVTYDHGYEVLPDDLRTATLQIASRLYFSATSSGSTQGGPLKVQSETIGGYTYRNEWDSSSTSTVVATLGLTAAEMLMLDRYRRATLG